MQFITPNGKVRNINIAHYMIDYDAPSLSKFQKQVKDFLRPFWEKSAVVLEEAPCVGTRMSLDFLNVSDHIAIEVQGAQHGKYTPHFHSQSRAKYIGQLRRDFRKDEWCTRNGLKLVEVFPSDMPLTVKWFQDKYQVTL